MKKDLFILILLKFCGFIWPISRFFNSQNKKFTIKYRKTFRLNSLIFKNIHTVEFIDLYIKDDLKGHLLIIDRLVLSVSLKELLLGRIMFTHCKINNLKIVYEKSKSQTNVPKQNDVSEKAEINLQTELRRLYVVMFKTLLPSFRLLPKSVICNEIRLYLHLEENLLEIVSHFNLENNIYELLVELIYGSDRETHKFNGRIESDKNGNSIYIASSEFNTLLIPHLFKKSQEIRAASIILNVSFQYLKRNDFISRIDLILRNIRIKDQNVNDEELIENIKLDLIGCYDLKGLVLNECSSITVNKLKFDLHLAHLFKDKDIFVGRVSLKHCTPRDILNSFPNFTLKDLYTCTATGYLSWELSLEFLLEDPYQYEFKINFLNELTSMNTGKLDLNYLNFPFKHKVSKDGILIKEIPLCCDNIHFTALKDISGYLRNTILFTEDRNFFNHKGIDTFFLGYALVTNLIERKYARGGSTITMQLTRNLFLNHKKNIYRKIEEIIISWMLENVFAITKERLFELYVNIIEFGDGLYGISEAADFYFSKAPGDLSLTESMVISYIIPRPKFFLDALKIKSPILLRNLKNHIQFFSNELLKAGKISEVEYQNVSNTIKFSKGLGTLYLEC